MNIMYRDNTLTTATKKKIITFRKLEELKMKEQTRLKEQ